MSNRFKRNLIMYIGATFTVIWFIAAIAVPIILDKRDSEISRGSSSIIYVVILAILLIISFHPLYLATVVASKLKTSPEQLKQKKYAAEFSSYDELKRCCEPLLTENGYRKILQSKPNPKNIHISAYTRPTETDEVFCFALSYAFLANNVYTLLVTICLEDPEERAEYREFALR